MAQNCQSLLEVNHMHLLLQETSFALIYNKETLRSDLKTYYQSFQLPLISSPHQDWLNPVFSFSFVKKQEKLNIIIAAGAWTIAEQLCVLISEAPGQRMELKTFKTLLPFSSSHRPRRAESPSTVCPPRHSFIQTLSE